MQLLGQLWAGAPINTARRQDQELLALQQPDGGWSQTPHLATDAYATGQVFYALAELKTPGLAGPIERAVNFLVRTEKADGTW